MSGDPALDLPFPEVALVTGASSGIGRATAVRLAALGSKVVVGYNSRREAAEKVVAELAGGSHVALRIALEDADSISTAAAEVGRRFGKLDALVNNAGSTTPVPAADLDGMTDEIFDRTVRINLRGPFSVIRAFRPLLDKGRHAAIVNVSSLAAQTGLGSSLAYCAAKGGLDTLTIALARALAPGIRVFSVSPAGVDTEFVPGRTRDQLEAMAGKMPLRKVTSADDVARAIVASITHLTSSTGIIVTVDEGRHL
jgi:3-oxoacyl-[acyl-carrier protein] reductase